MTDETFIFDDFGFSAVSEAEVTAMPIAEKEDVENRLDQMHQAITFFLNKLKENPELEYIKWPDRVTHIEKFEQRLTDIKNATVK